MLRNSKKIFLQLLIPPPAEALLCRRRGEMLLMTVVRCCGSRALFKSRKIWFECVMLCFLLTQLEQVHGHVYTDPLCNHSKIMIVP